MKISLIVILVILLAVAPIKAEKYAGEFLYLGAGARSLALGGAYSIIGGDPYSSYYNPAGLADLNGRQAAFMHSETFGSLLNHDYLAVAQSKFNGVAAISLYRLGGGGILITEEYMGTYRVRETASHADYVLTLSYGRRQSGRLNIGLSAKLIYRSIIDYSAKGIGFDAGAKYESAAGFSGALVARDMTGTILSYSSGSKETVNPTLIAGLGYRRKLGDFAALAVGDADFRFEGRKGSAQFYQGWISADLHFGVEASYKDIVYARAGSDTGNLTTGIGLKVARFAIDLALLDHDDLDTSYRGSLVVSW